MAFNSIFARKFYLPIFTFMNTEAIGAIAIFVLMFGSISRRLEKSLITPPMAYVVCGLLISSAALGEKLLNIPENNHQKCRQCQGKQQCFLGLFTNHADDDNDCKSN